MQPKDRRLVTEQNLEAFTEAELVPVKASVGVASSQANQAISIAQGADTKSDDAMTRVEYIETMAGLAPGEVTDAQTASLVQQPTSSTRQALNTATVQAARASGVFAVAKGANLSRTLRRLQSGEDLTFSVIGDSLVDVNGPWNTDGGPVEKTATILENRFGVNINIANFARGGYTAAHLFGMGHVNDAIDAQADVVFICLGKNDIVSDMNRYASGYPMEASHAAIERMCAIIRKENDKADIVILLEGPYRDAGERNDYLRAYEEKLRSVAAVWGAEVIDIYQAFMDYGDYTELMYDNSHQNAAGNDLYAATMAEHFPADFNGPTISAAPPASKGLYKVDNVNLDVGRYGYVARSNPGASDGITLATVGTWDQRISSTPGSYLEVTGNFTEVLASIDVSPTHSPVVDVIIDGTTVQMDLALSGQGGLSGMRMIPFALGLDPGEHTFRLVLKAGTLEYLNVFAVAGTSTIFDSPIRAVHVGERVPEQFMLTTTLQNMIPPKTIPLPDGWNSMDIQLSGWAAFRVNGETSARRTITTSLRVGGVNTQGIRTMDVGLHNTTFMMPPFALQGTSYGHTGDALIDARATINATDNIQFMNCYLDAVLIRTS